MPTPEKPSSQKRHPLRFLLWLLPMAGLFLWRFSDVKEKWQTAFSQDSLVVPLVDSTLILEKKREKEMPFPKMIHIAGGTFTMGSTNSDSDEWPLHEVRVSGFELGKYEVTNAQFCAFLNAKGNQKRREISWLEIEGTYCLIEQKEGKFVPKAGFDLFPVVEVNWFGALAYTEWLNEVSGQKGWRLPTEAEWEYAAGGGEEQRNAYSGTNFERYLSSYAWYERNSKSQMHEVGTTLKPNNLGLYDMSGNVWEWCADRYNSSYYAQCKAKGLSIDPQGHPSVYNTQRIQRGGSAFRPAAFCRASFRQEINPYNRLDDSGFRLARTP